MKDVAPYSRWDEAAVAWSSSDNRSAAALDLDAVGCNMIGRSLLLLRFAAGGFVTVAEPHPL